MPVPPRVIPNPVPTRPPGTACANPEPKLRYERFTGAGINKEFTLKNEVVLVVPFNSGFLGNVRKFAFGDPATGEHFKKTVIISKCPGVYNPEQYDYETSVDECAFTGLEISYSVISSKSR